MKKSTIKTTIGTINLGNIELVDDSMSILIGIDSVSDKLQAKINKAIEIEKTSNVFKKNWSDNTIIDNTYLSIDLEFGKAIQYDINVIFHDGEDPKSYGDISLSVDLSAYQSELKKVIVKSIIDSFF